jgi:crossover junction endodeoxyribonuclease RusA
MTERITLTLPLPPSINHYWRRVGNKTLISADGRAYRTRCGVEAHLQGVEPLAGELAVRAVIFMARRGSDLDNRLKALLDSLNGVCWMDDGQVAEIHVRRELDRTNPRVEMTVEPLRAAEE